MSNNTERGNDKINFLLHLIQQFFKDSIVDLWLLVHSNSSFSYYNTSSSDFCLVENNKFEEIADSMRKNIYFLSNNVNLILELDIEKRPLLCFLYRIIWNSYAITIRKKEAFNYLDILRFKQIAPLVFSLIHMNYKPNANDSNLINQKVKAIFEVSELFRSVVDFNHLRQTIEEKLKMIFQVEQCSLFLIDIHHQMIITRFQDGERQDISCGLNQGIVGYTAKTGQVVNLLDVEEDSRFDREVDISSSLKKYTLLSAPILNSQNEIIYVIELINRKDQSKFDEDDINLIKAFNSFLGIFFDNTKLFQSSFDSTQQLQDLIDISLILNQKIEIKKSLEIILKKVHDLIQSSRETIFSFNQELNEISPVLSSGSKIVHGNFFLSLSLNTKSLIYFQGMRSIKFLSTNHLISL
jgi:hypothetical protein